MHFPKHHYFNDSNIMFIVLSTSNCNSRKVCTLRVTRFPLRTIISIVPLQRWSFTKRPTCSTVCVFEISPDYLEKDTKITSLAQRDMECPHIFLKCVTTSHAYQASKIFRTLLFYSFCI